MFNQTGDGTSGILSRCLSTLPYSDLVKILIEVYRTLQQVIRHNLPEGVYEILDFDCTLELKDVKGEVAIFKRWQKVKFLQDDVIAFQDRIWGEGKILADYKCSPGVEADRYQEGDRWNILISLRETKNSGDVENFYIERTVHNGFTKREEWQQSDVLYNTRHIKLSTIFPKHRHCQRAVLVERNRNRTRVLGPEYFSELPDGRQVLVWEMKNPRRFETYTIKWRW
ncbi:MAG: hypothetical protein EXR62_07750 [Chloroflexi bacterium]|nr:hypothetical protein [Chloroflexota bacterium]